MKILEDDTYIVVPLAGVYRIFAMSSRTSTSPTRTPSFTNQTWQSLSITPEVGRPGDWRPEPT